MQRVHLRFNNSSGQPTAVRLRVTDAAGTYYAPFGRLTRFATEPGVDVGANVLLDDGPWAIIDGACEIDLPPGELKVQARKGPEWRPFDVDLSLAPGKMAFRFTMERSCDLAADGWYSGDTCAYNISPHAALLEAMAQDLAVVDLLVREQPGSLVNIAAYSGQQPALAKPGHTVVVNTANQSPFGRLLLLNTHRTVYPLSFERGEKWSLVDWCDQCHRKNGLVVADDWLLQPDEPELQTEEFLGRVDAIRFHAGVSLKPWYDALNRGHKLPLVAGSGKESNRELLGSWRTYAQVADGSTPAAAQQPGCFDYASWTEAIRAGRTFVTNGPLLKFDGRVTEAIGAVDRIRIIAGGEVIAEASASRLECPAFATWAVAICEGADGMAISSPRYFG